MKKLLFVCSENRFRSPTAEAVFSDHRAIEAIGVGTNTDAATPISGDLVEWADIILVMEKIHKKKISQKFRALLKEKRLMVLDIPDHSEYMQPELIQLLKSKVTKILRL